MTSIDKDTKDTVMENQWKQTNIYRHIYIISRDNYGNLTIRPEFDGCTKSTKGLSYKNRTHREFKVGDHVCIKVMTKKSS